MSWTVGLTLAGRFRLDAALGASGNPQVWAATHLPTGRRVAIRRLEAPAELPARALSQIVSDVRAAAAVQHPNVAELYEVLEGTADGPLMISELLRGETLAQKLSRHPMLSLRETASLLVPVVSAVGTAHARGIVHGGLSASNVFLWGGGGAVPAIKVLDFGLAKWSAAVEQVPASVRPGAPAGRRLSEYAPPEQALPGRTVDHRADTWALGIILYECLSGLRPRDFIPPEADLAAAVAFTPIDQRAPAVPRAISDIIAHLLVSDPDHRAQNLIELFHALSPLADRPSPNFGWPGSERRISGLTQRLIAPERLTPPPAPQSPPARVDWRSFALVASGLAALELVALVWLLVRSPRGPEAPPPSASAASSPAAAPPALTATRSRHASSSSNTASALATEAASGAAVSAALSAGNSEARAEMMLRPAAARAPLLDDFEDGNAAPLASAFDSWQSFTVNPAGRALPLRLGPGYESRGSVEMSWMLEDAHDDELGRPGAGLRSPARAGSVDLARYSHLTFVHRHAPMITPGLECRGATEFVVFVTCRAQGQEGVTQFELSLPTSEAWAVAEVDLRDLNEVSGSSPHRTNLKACLAAADSVGFRADGSIDLDSGGCDSGTLWLDDIGFR